MRSAALLRLAFGLLAVDSVVAGPCIPPGTTTTAVTSTASTEASSTTAESTTSTVTTESSVETSASSTVSQSSAETSSSTVSVETSASSTATETSTSFATETTASSTTTDSTTTTGDMTTSTTSTAATPTFSIIAVGSGPVEGNALQSYNNANAFVMFRTDIGGGDSVRPYHIDSQGRLMNDQGYYLCGYYDSYNEDLDRPAVVITCTGEYPVTQAFLTCQQTADLKVTCSLPAIACVPGDPNDPFSEPDCQAGVGTWDNLYTSEVGPGIGLHIGPPNAGSDYDPVELGIQIV